MAPPCPVQDEFDSSLVRPPFSLEVQHEDTTGFSIRSILMPGGVGCPVAGLTLKDEQAGSAYCSSPGSMVV